MKRPSSEYRPSLWGIIGVFAVIVALQVFNLTTRNDVLTAVVTIVICSSYVAWWFWSNRYR